MFSNSAGQTPKERLGYSADMRVFRWILVVSIFWVCSYWAVGSRVVLDLLEESWLTYEALGLPPPSLALVILGLFIEVLDFWPVKIVLAVFGTIALCGSGLILVWNVRPVDTRSDLVLGIRAGFTAAVFYVLCGGWTVAMATIVVPTIPELKGMGDAISLMQNDVNELEDGTKVEDVLALYPYAKDVPKKRQGQLIFAKVLADLSVRSSLMFFALTPLLASLIILTVTFQVLVAGFVSRDLGKSGASLLCSYLELIFPSAVIFTFLGKALVSLLASNLVQTPVTQLSLPTVALGLAIAAIAYIGLRRGWSGRIRLRGYVLAVGAYLLLLLATGAAV